MCPHWPFGWWGHTFLCLVGFLFGGFFLGGGFVDLCEVSDGVGCGFE